MVAALVTTAVATIASTVTQVQTANKQASVARSVADYNAKTDIANAQQLEMDANANIQRQRLADKSYLSSQRAAYAASGILSETGSPSTVMATTAGRQEMDIQQYWANTQQKESSLYAAAQEGRYEGEQAAETYHLQGQADIFNGIGSLASLGGSYAKYKEGI